jgi:hypothetical protein
MTDPPRLFQDEATDEGRLLRAAIQESPPVRAVERTLAAIAAGGTVLGTATSAGAKVGLWTVAKWASAGVVSGLVTV